MQIFPKPVLRTFASAAAVLGFCLAGGLATASAAATGMPSKEQCIYTAHKISILDRFERQIGHQINCVLVYNDASPNWAGWERPWFDNYVNEPNVDWSAWDTAPGTRRRLIITQNLFPTSVNHDHWLRLGAAGAYTSHAKILAQNLVAAGLGNSIIRLGHEANGSWYPDSLGNNQAEWSLWDKFWRKTVLAMKSVPGAHFEFDWCIAALWRAIPLKDIYPGNDVVNIIGVDAYDTGNIGSSAAERWNYTYNGPDGIKTVLDFAKAHGKPMSIPEWGVSPRRQAKGFGDDPTFVNGIASVVRDDHVAYQSYFYNYGYATQLSDGRRSWSAYRDHFGVRGDSLGLPVPRAPRSRVGKSKPRSRSRRQAMMRIDAVGLRRSKR